MAMWMIGKAKNLGSKLQGVKDIGSRLAGMMAHSPSVEDQLPADQSLLPVDKTKQEPLFNTKKYVAPEKKDHMELQYQEYQKLNNLQDALLAQLKQQSLGQLKAQQQALQKQLKLIQQQHLGQRLQTEKYQTLKAIEEGSKTIEDVLEENILMKEQLYANQNA